MQTYSTLVITELVKGIEAKIEYLRDTLEQNPECRVEFTRGQINALRMMSELIADAEKAAQQDKR